MQKPSSSRKGAKAETHDLHGFLLTLNLQARSDLAECRKQEEQQVQEWNSYAESKTLPSGGKLKKLVRKVS